MLNLSLQKPPRLAPFITSGLSVAIGATLTALLMLDLASPPAARAQLIYSAEGSAIEGSLGGVTFTNAEWKVSAVADENLSTNLVFTRPTLGIFDFWLMPVSPRAVIRYGTGQTLEVELLPSEILRWTLVSGKFPVGPTPKIGFVYANPSFTQETAAGLASVPSDQYPDLYINFKSPVELFAPSVFERATYRTNRGDLIITGTTNNIGRFSIEVPGPWPLLGLPVAMGWSRRLRCRIAAHRLSSAVSADQESA